jgi:2-phospho-L-lactate guanylyltransferase
MSGHGDLWSVLVPVKRLERAKSRLVVPDDRRAELALAMATDTVAAALAAPCIDEVVVITDDRRAAATLADLGARIVGDQPDAGLNPALRHGATLASLPRIAALSSDLPSLLPEDLDALLKAAAGFPRAVVADHRGTGTTLLAAVGLACFEPAFGEGSFTAHLGLGAVDLSGRAGLTLRHDVDTVDALDHALEIGVGPATARAAARVG